MEAATRTRDGVSKRNGGGNPSRIRRLLQEGANDPATAFDDLDELGKRRAKRTK